MTLVNQAQAELARRELARRSVAHFAAYVDPDQADNYRAAHLQLLANYLDRAESGELWRDVPGDGVKILVVTMPPRHWKSSLVSRKYPAWFIGKRQRIGSPHQVILTSYGASLAESNNRAVLELCRDNALYRNVFPNIRISKKSQSVQEWWLEGEPVPTAVAVGVGGGLTGHGADLLIIDDPIKDRAEANSPALRDRLWNWWTDVARTRVNPDGFVVFVLTRWHPDDPVGRLLQDSGDRVVLLRLPALAETDQQRQEAASMGLPVDDADPLGRQPGEPLWPERYDAPYLEVIREQTPQTFAALYQGRPAPDGGWLVGRNVFKTLPMMPKNNVRWVWATDWAITAQEAAPKRSDPDYTAVGLIGWWQPGGQDDGRLVIAFMGRKQADLHDARIFVRDTVLTHRAMIVANSYGKQRPHDALGLDALRRDASLLGYRYRIKGLAVKGDKVTLAQPWLERAQAGQVYVVNGAWNDEFFQEVEAFPHGAHDDMVDVVSIGAAALGIGAKDKKAKAAKVNFYG